MAAIWTKSALLVPGRHRVGKVSPFLEAKASLDLLRCAIEQLIRMTKKLSLRITVDTLNHTHNRR